VPFSNWLDCCYCRRTLPRTNTCPNSSQSARCKHEVHEVGGGISESERHYQELVKTITSGKRGFGNVARSNLDLVVDRTKVDFREDFGTSQLIKRNIDSGKRVFVFDGDCIERSVIYAHP
jgi:hypothetical protein